MPNWCSNYMTISGDAAQVAELVGKYIEEGMCFAGYYDNIGRDLYDHHCEDDNYRKFGIEHFGYEYEDSEDDEDEQARLF